MIAGLAVEAALLRLFARGGVYFLREGSPELLRRLYAVLVDVGVVALNFATITAFAVVGLLALMAAQRGRSIDRALALLLALLFGLSLASAVWHPGPAAALVYLAVSALTAAAIVARPPAGPRQRLRLLAGTALAAAYLLLLAARALPLAGQLGWGAGTGVGTVAVAAELATALAVVLAVAAFVRRWAWRDAAAGGVTAVLLTGMAFGMPDVVPLIGIWSFGMTLDLPILVYAVGAGLAVWIGLAALRQGRPWLAAGVAALFLSHRLLPLTYFNLLFVIGLALIVYGAAQSPLPNSRGRGSGQGGPNLASRHPSF